MVQIIEWISALFLTIYQRGLQSQKMLSSCFAAWWMTVKWMHSRIRWSSALLVYHVTIWSCLHCSKCLLFSHYTKNWRLDRFRDFSEFHIKVICTDLRLLFSKSCLSESHEFWWNWNQLIRQQIILLSTHSCEQPDFFQSPFSGYWIFTLNNP